MSFAELIDMSLHMALLSLMAVGGVTAVLPDIHRYVVEAQGWMNSEQFAALFALSQAAPGPNALFITLFGLQMAGLPGAFGATLGMFAPSSLLAYHAIGWADLFAHTRWLNAFRRGMAPITVGLVLSSGFLLAQAGNINLSSIILTSLTVAVLLLRSRWNPLWLIIAGALFGLLA
ncbi:MAG: chromate transporter [Burkholderiaceae bacterium]